MTEKQNAFKVSYVLLVVLAIPIIASAQAVSRPTPSIATGGVVNNASYAPNPNPLAPGSIAAIFGTDLTDGSSCLKPSCDPSFGNDGKLRTTMAGTQVRVNGVPVPIFYASPGQLGVQIPTELSGSAATVQVSVGGQTDAPQTIFVDAVSPGIFTFTADGKGAGAITHADALGTPVSSQNPAQPGEVVIIYATGLGQVTPPVPTGALPSGESRTVAPVTVTIDGIPVTPDFAGLAGCCVGLNQVNVQIPANIRSASDISIVLNVGGKLSNSATIATAGAAPPPPPEPEPPPYDYGY